MPDSTPNYLSIDSDGLVTAQFSGSVELIAPDLNTVPSSNSIEWHGLSFIGPIVYRIFSRCQALAVDAYHQVIGAGGREASLTLSVERSGSNVLSQVTMDTAIPSVQATVLDSVGSAHNVKLIDGNDHSSFAQVPTNAFKVLVGLYQFSGVIPAGASTQTLNAADPSLKILSGNTFTNAQVSARPAAGTSITNLEINGFNISLGKVDSVRVNVSSSIAQSCTLYALVIGVYT